MDNVLDVVNNIGLWLLLIIILSVVYNLVEKYINAITKVVDDSITPEQWNVIEQIAYRLVQSADQLFGLTGDNQEKLQYVMGLITKQYPALDEQLLRSVIEGIYSEYKKFRQEIIND